MKHMLIAVSALAFVCVAAPAQTEDAKPGPKLKTWDVWVGDWTFVEQAKDSPSGTEQKVEGTAQGRWMGDSFFVFRSQSKDEAGKETSSIGITGYDPIKKAYFTHSFRSDGSSGTSSVTFGDKIVTEDWEGLTASGEKTRHRYTYGLSEQENEETAETFTDGKWWVSAKVKWTKVK